jgi:uncharacterized RDD family membrane protein YckC
LEEIKASRSSRIFAFIIDHFVLTLVTVFPLIFIMMKEELQMGSKLAIIGIWIFLVLILYIFKDTFKGQSIGKRLIGIAVRDEHKKGVVPSVRRLILRNALLVIWPIEFIVLAADEKKQRLGDRISNTVVVKVKKISIWKVITAVLFAVIISFVLLFAIILLSLKNSDSYQSAIAYIESNDEVTGITGGIEGYGFFPSGNVQISNGSGEAAYSIEIKGKDKDIYMQVYLTKKPAQEWIVSEAYYE